MRKVLLLIALSMLGVPMFASVASAEHTAKHVRAGSDGSMDPGNPYGCPDGKPFVATVPGDPGEGSLQCFATQAEATAYSNTSSSASPMASPTAAPTASSTATPSASASATAAATSQYSAPSLPETGGFSPVTYLAPVALLLVGGLFTAKIVRRG